MPTRLRAALDLLARPETHRYGPHRAQRADLHLPRDRPGPHRVVVTLHGGSWGPHYGKVLMKPLAEDLTRRGFAVWNAGYRRLGPDGGGWPATFADVAAAVDHLAALDDDRLDLDAGVTLLGHSAGGHLALWAASRARLPQDAPGAGGSPVRLRLAVGQAAVADLTGAQRASPGGAIEDLLDGDPTTVPERYALADPARLVPPACPVLLVHGTQDGTVGVARSRDYAAAARAAGADVRLVEVDGAAGGHVRHLDPAGAAWAEVTAWL